MPENPFNALRIHCVHYRENIYPWLQQDTVIPHWRFYWSPEAGGEISFDGQNMPLESDFFYLIPGYFRFSTRARKPFSQFYIHFNIDDRIPRAGQVFRLPAEESDRKYIRSFIAGAAQKGNFFRNRLAAETVLIHTLLRLPDEILQIPEQLDPRIERIMEYISRHLNRRVDNPELAEVAGMSCNSFIRFFSANAGESPQAYMRRKRIEYVCELLHNDKLSMDEIAEASGFAGRFHLSRVFWKELYCTPAAYRRSLYAENTVPRSKRKKRP